MTDPLSSKECLPDDGKGPPPPWIVRKWRDRRYLPGMLLQWARFPGFVRAGEYRSLGCSITVKCSRYFTVITVKGVDYYFYRASGGFDGAGFDPSSVHTVAGERLVNSLKDAT